MLDFHNHIIPGVDDGSESLEQSLSALETMWEHGITHVITTPHFQASTVKRPEFESVMGRIDAGWARLVESAREKVPQMKLDRGVELALDDPSPVATDPRLRLAGSRFILVEFPWFTIPPHSVQPLNHLKASGLAPIVAHPERYINIDPQMKVFREWKRAGAFLQLNAGSLVGAYGARIERNAWRLLNEGLADYLSSDYHARGNCPIRAAVERLTSRGGAAQMKGLTEHNGNRLIQGLDSVPVLSLVSSESPWRRLLRAFGRQ